MDKKRYFKLNCLVILVGNRILRKEWNEVYNEDDLGDQVNELLKSGKIIETDKKGNPLKEGEKKKASKEEETGEESGGEENSKEESGDNSGEESTIPKYEDVTANQIKEKLVTLGVEHNTDDKSELYELLKQNWEG